jgi:hypothetical protein
VLGPEGGAVGRQFLQARAFRGDLAFDARVQCANYIKNVRAFLETSRPGAKSKGGSPIATMKARRSFVFLYGPPSRPSYASIHPREQRRRDACAYKAICHSSSSSSRRTDRDPSLRPGCCERPHTVSSKQLR